MFGWIKRLKQTTIIEYTDQNGVFHRKRVNKNDLNLAIEKFKNDTGAKELDACIAHILDSFKGYYTANWVIDEDIPRDMYDRHRIGQNIYVMTYYESGLPKSAVVKKDVWDGLRRMHDRG